MKGGTGLNMLFPRGAISIVCIWCHGIFCCHSAKPTVCFRPTKRIRTSEHHLWTLLGAFFFSLKYSAEKKSPTITSFR